MHAIKQRAFNLWLVVHRYECTLTSLQVSSYACRLCKLHRLMHVLQDGDALAAACSDMDKSTASAEHMTGIAHSLTVPELLPGSKDPPSQSPAVMVPCRSPPPPPPTPPPVPPLKFMSKLTDNAVVLSGRGLRVCSLHRQPSRLALGAARQVPQEPAAGLPTHLLPARCQHRPGGRPCCQPGSGPGGLLGLPLTHGCCSHLGLQVPLLI